MKQLVLLLAFFCFVSCKTTQQKTAKQYLSLTNKEYKSIKKDQDIINSLYSLINDSVQLKKIDKALNKYLTGDYRRSQLINAIEIYSVFGNAAEITYIKVDSTHKNIPKLNTIEEMKAFDQKFKNGFEIKAEHVQTIIIKDSIKP